MTTLLHKGSYMNAHGLIITTAITFIEIGWSRTSSDRIDLYFIFQ